jgi:hypothetical protein
VEVHSSGGSLDSPGNVRVTVERFGSERMQDSMFENYDARCEERVRGAFRLPPIFVGKSKDYNFATAFASYTVAEAQVFVPERDEFDEIINNTVMRELDPEGLYAYRSLPMTVNDVTTQLEALGMVQSDLSKEGRIEAVNEITGMSLKPSEEEEKEKPSMTMDQFGNPVTDLEPVPGGTEVPAAGSSSPPGAPAAPPGPASQPRPLPTRKMDTFDMMELVSQWCRAQLTDELNETEIASIQTFIKRMSGDDRERFDGYVTMRLMSALDHDMMGAIELVGAASDIAEHPHDCIG